MPAGVARHTVSLWESQLDVRRTAPRRPSFALGWIRRAFFVLAARSRICKGRWQQLRLPVPLRGIAALPFESSGFGPSRMNRNTRTVFEMIFTKVMRATKVSVDVRALLRVSSELVGYALSTGLWSPLNSTPRSRGNLP